MWCNFKFESVLFRSDSRHDDRVVSLQGRIQDFKLGGRTLKKLRRAEGGAKIFGVFRVKNHHFTPKKSYLFQFYGGARRVRPPPLDPPLI